MDRDFLAVGVHQTDDGLVGYVVSARGGEVLHNTNPVKLGLEVHDDWVAAKGLAVYWAEKNHPDKGVIYHTHYESERAIAA